MLFQIQSNLPLSITNYSVSIHYNAGSQVREGYSGHNLSCISDVELLIFQKCVS